MLMTPPSPPSSSLATRIGRELAGGLTATAIAVPASIGFGLFAFAPLGEHMQASAISAALISAFIVPLVCVLLGSSTGLVYTPRSIISFMVAAVAAQGIVASSLFAQNMPADEVAVTYLALALIIAGLAQTLAGLLRLGGAIKYVPFPVMSGFQNSAALLLLVAQIPPLTTDPPTLIIGAVTALLSWFGSRVTRRVPAPILALVGGALLYHLLALVIATAPGATIQASNLPMPSTEAAGRIPALIGLIDTIDVLVITITALGVAMVASMDTLLSARLVEQRSGSHSSSNGELLRIGIGNFTAACAGGIPSGVQVGASIASHSAGGRGRLSTAIAGLLSGAVLLWLQPVLAIVPRAVIAGLLLVVALQLFDRWTLQALHGMARGKLRNWRATLLDLALMAVVAFLAIATHIVLAVIAGVTIAIVVFFLRMSRPSIRRAYRCENVRARRLRNARDNAVLASRGGEILVVELEGPLFFGSAEQIAASVQTAMSAGARFVILDMRHVTDVDSTGARILSALKERLGKTGVALAISYIPSGSPLFGTLSDIGIVADLGHGHLFADTDTAIEWAEDAILADSGAAPNEREMELEQLDILAGLAPADREAVSTLFRRRTYKKGEFVVREGEPGRELYVIARGRATARTRIGHPAREVRLLTFPTGTTFGELAVVDHLERSASVTADEDLACWVLSQDEFDRLKTSNPAAALQLLGNVAREMGQRLRRANLTICELDA